MVLRDQDWGYRQEVLFTKLVQVLLVSIALMSAERLHGVL